MNQYKRLLAATVATLMVTQLTVAQQPQTAKQPAPSRPAFAAPEVDPSLPNVLSIGDSISIGYLLPLRSELDGEANVFRPATNCGPTTRGLEQLEQWLGDRHWDVIHFNFGLHDLKYLGPNGENLADPSDSRSHQQVPIEEYEQNLRKIARRLKETGATVIWRETTPVPEGAKGRVTGDSARYNIIAAKVMREVGDIAIDPMYDYASKEPIVSEQRPANVHYTDRGSRLLGKRAAKSIRAAIGAD